MVISVLIRNNRDSHFDHNRAALQLTRMSEPNNKLSICRSDFRHQCWRQNKMQEITPLQKNSSPESSCKKPSNYLSIDRKSVTFN